MDDLYSKESEKFVRETLTRYHSISQRRFDGDFGACDILMDLNNAIEEAGLTHRQLEIMHYVYMLDHPQEETGVRLGVRRQVINEHLMFAIRKIAAACDIGLHEEGEVAV